MKEITPYLIFDGNCREAMTFYQSCVGGDLHVMTFGEADSKAPRESKDRLIHARLAKGAMVIMASDSMQGAPHAQGNDVWLSAACDSDDEVDSLFPKLSTGGKPVMEPHDAFWNARFAMLTDRFGINWMLSHEQPKKG